MSSLLVGVEQGSIPPALKEEMIDEARRVSAKFGKRHVLLIGGGGYIGPVIAAELLRSGYGVRNLDLFLYGTQASVAALLLDPNYEVVVGDLGDPDVVKAALAGITDVIVMGGLVGDPITKQYPAEAAAINERGIARCLAALDGAGLNKVILISTCSNYGLMSHNELANEQSDLKPLSAYATAKVLAEKAFLARQSVSDYHGVVLRFATAFGVAPRMRFDLTVNEFTRDLFFKVPLVVYDPDTWRPYCHVKDFAAIILRVLEAPISRVRGEVFNAGGDKNNLTKRNIVDIILKRFPDRAVSYQEHGTDPRNYRVDFSKLRERLAFEPAFDVEWGITELVDALSKGFFSDYAERANYYGNYHLNYRTSN